MFLASVVGWAPCRLTSRAAESATELDRLPVGRSPGREVDDAECTQDTFRAEGHCSCIQFGGLPGGIHFVRGYFASIDDRTQPEGVPSNHCARKQVGGRTFQPPASSLTVGNMLRLSLYPP